MSEHRSLGIPANVVASTRSALEQLKAMAMVDAQLPGVEVLTQRAAFSSLSSQGAVSPGGSCHIMATDDGYWALSLARADDFELVPALISGASSEEWAAIEQWSITRGSADCVSWARTLGLAAAAVPDFIEPLLPVAPYVQEPMVTRAPVVIDLSALWAGPLCTQLLRLCGARVIKVESVSRPDGARLGNPDFFTHLNAGKEELSLDLASASGRSQLLDLIAAADIVVESSRPRALQQLGIRAEELTATCRDLTWLSITAYGRTGEQAHWIGYGDDVAVAAGCVDYSQGTPGFCGDALADPVTGVSAAVSALSGYLAGGLGVLDFSMLDAMRAALSGPSC